MRVYHPRPVANDGTCFDPLSPSDYFHLRREAAGLTREQLARRLAQTFTASSPAPIHAARSLIDQLEAHGARARYPDTIEVIATIISLDASVYWQLADEPADRHPMVCRACGCSAHDPCYANGGICSLEHDICTRCTGTAEQVAA